MDEGPDHLSKTRARAGTTPHVARYVLIFGTSLTIIAFIIIYMMFM
jgi:hypothetical protein